MVTVQLACPPSVQTGPQRHPLWVELPCRIARFAKLLFLARTIPADCNGARRVALTDFNEAALGASTLSAKPSSPRNDRTRSDVSTWCPYPTVRCQSA